MNRFEHFRKLAEHGATFEQAFEQSGLNALPNARNAAARRLLNRLYARCHSVWYAKQQQADA